MKLINFWCDDCKLEQELPYAEAKCLGARWNESLCRKCGRKVIRYITERHRDPYWFRSAKAIQERRKFSKDLIQPSDPDFKKYYPREYERLEAVKEENDKKRLDAMRKRDDMYKRFGNNPRRRKVLSKLYDNI